MDTQQHPPAIFYTVPNNRTNSKSLGMRFGLSYFTLVTQLVGSIATCRATDNQQSLMLPFVMVAIGGSLPISLFSCQYCRLLYYPLLLSVNCRLCCVIASQRLRFVKRLVSTVNILSQIQFRDSLSVLDLIRTTVHCYILLDLLCRGICCDNLVCRASR